MHDWVYIATPSGASVGRTVALAKGGGRSRRRRTFGVGVIRRRVDRDVPYLTELRPGHSILLMYDLFHVGLVYPIGTFRIRPPERGYNPTARQLEGYPAIAVLTNPEDLMVLDPEYTSPGGSEEHVVLGSFRELPSAERLRLCRRTGADDHALHPAGRECPLLPISEDEASSIVRDRLAPHGSRCEEAAMALAGTGWPVASLDGRSQQPLGECQIAEVALGEHAPSYALAAQPLCALAEHELQGVLTRAARARPAADLGVSWVDRAGEGVEYWLSWIPDPCVYEYEMYESVCALRHLGRSDTGLAAHQRDRLANLLDRIRQVRNRLAHSHFLEEHHYNDLRDSVREMLITIHGWG
jgi:hypothetical protein